MEQRFPFVVMAIVGVFVITRRLHWLVPLALGRTRWPSRPKALSFGVAALALYTLLLVAALEAGVVSGVVFGRGPALSILDHVWPFAFGWMIAAPFVLTISALMAMALRPKGPWRPERRPAAGSTWIAGSTSLATTPDERSGT